MSEPLDSQPDATPNDKLSSVKPTEPLPEMLLVSHLKLVVSEDLKKTRKTPAVPLKLAVSAPIYRSAPTKSSSFTAEIRKRSPYDFVMVARDPFHYLNCELPLKFEENQEGGKRSFLLVCQFPLICDEELVDFIEGDEDLLGIIMIQFQMQILKNLLAFCAAQNIGNLIISATEEQFEGLGIYQGFIKYVDKIPTKKGISVEMAIPIHPNSLVECNEFMDDMMMQFRETLWKEQKINPAIRDYLKTNVRLSIITSTNEYGHYPTNSQ